MTEPEKRTGGTTDGRAHVVTVAPTVNGVRCPARVDVRTTLVELLRDDLGLTGTKIGCHQGTCGACTVLLDGERVLSCLMLAVVADGARVVTIEGVAGPGGTLHPLQRAFVEADALQCGFCTPGQIMSALGLLAERAGPLPDDERLRDLLSGNLCRCSAYPAILAAVRAAADGCED